MNIGGVEYELVTERGPVSVYRGSETYLRIGPRAILQGELDTHLQLLRLGFPVPKVLDTGTHQEMLYFIEESAGDWTFGDIFDNETVNSGRISDRSFGAFLGVILNYAAAQLASSIASSPSSTFAVIVGREAAAKALPQLSEQTTKAFDWAVERLGRFPAVLTHGDFHAFNVCPSGVIDLEQVDWGFAGYDIIGALETPALFPPDPETYQFALEQQSEYLDRIDALFIEKGFEPPSRYLDDIRMCRAMSLVAMRRRPAWVLEWLDDRYEALLQSYFSTVRSPDG